MSAAVHRPALLVADRWKDYELIDCGDGLKQERWGDIRLVRPDPQVIWPRHATWLAGAPLAGDRASKAEGGTGKARTSASDAPTGKPGAKSSSNSWDKWDGFYHRSEQGGGKWEFRRPLPDHWTIGYDPLGLSFKIHPTSFKHTGLFPEQAVNWDWMSAKITAARKGGRTLNVLNLFGYTGAATVAAAKAGASVCHVDAAEGMVKWCRENAALSGLAGAPIRYIVDDCLKFARRELKRGRHYDAIIMDPPTYGRGSTGEMWRLEDHLWDLLVECRALLTEAPLFFLINAYTARLSPTVVANLLSELMHGRDGTITAGEVGLPIKRDGKILPCGIYGRWER